MRCSVYIVFLLLLASCTSWETKKVSTSELLHKKWEAISLTEVGEYPSFTVCDTTQDRLDHKSCFENTIQQTLVHALALQQLVVTQPVNDTVWIDFVINEKGVFCLDSLRISQEVRTEVPLLEAWIQDAVVQFPEAQPATKRGLPVKAKFKIPVVLKAH